MLFGSGLELRDKGAVWAYKGTGLSVRRNAGLCVTRFCVVLANRHSLVVFIFSKAKMLT